MAEDTLVDKWIAKAKNQKWVAAACLLVIVMSAIAMFTDSLGKLWGLVPGHSPYSVVILHEPDQPGRISPYKDSGIVISRWAAIVSNNSDRADSLMRLSVAAHREGQNLEYAGFNGGLLGKLYDAKGNQIEFPINLSKGSSTRIYFELSVILDVQAFELLSKTYPNGEIPNLHEANKVVASVLDTDLFGQPAELMKVEGNGPLGFGIAIFSNQRNPVITITFTTSREVKIQGSGNWYSSERAAGPMSPEDARLGAD